ncbi:MAG TPA: ATP synthase F1 subunit delta [Cyclobacteriaceae bacterium]
MADLRVASRYVKSLLSLAVEQGAVEAVHNDMELFTKTVNESKDLALMLHSPIIKHDTKKAILNKIFKGKVHALTMAIIDILTQKNREPLLPSIAKEFHNAYNEYKGIGKATITTPIALDAALRAEIEKMVKKISTKDKVELIEKTDKDMIGGFILNVGDRQIDTSIKNKLKALKVKFKENPYIKEF